VAKTIQVWALVDKDGELISVRKHRSNISDLAASYAVECKVVPATLTLEASDDDR
jgi:hypothetical protein